jgi:hypothetical protein
MQVKTYSIKYTCNRCGKTVNSAAQFINDKWSTITIKGHVIMGYGVKGESLYDSEEADYCRLCFRAAMGGLCLTGNWRIL